MTLLKFFLDWGKNGLGFLWVPYISLSIWFLYQAYVASKSGWREDSINHHAEGDENIPFYKQTMFYYFLALTVAAIVVHLLIRSEA